MRELKNDARLAIVAPFPYPDRTQEGWMSRIGSIDRQFSGIRRIYLHFSDQHNDAAADILWRDPERAEVYVHPYGPISSALISQIFEKVKIVYVHTLNLAQYIKQWLSTGKVCVDIHGITPEEEVMLGRPDAKDHYEHLEQEVLRSALRCIAVSDSMIDHYREKYPYIKPQWIMIPIFEAYPNCDNIKSNTSVNTPKVRVIYTGGIQVWQNISAMFDMVKNTSHWASYAFYSHDYKLMQKIAKSTGIGDSAVFSFAPKNEMPSVYSQADFGLVIRDDCPVNRVSCPTKLTEYLLFGIVPIVRSSRLGDYSKYGFVYVTEDEFKQGVFPNRAAREWIIRRNLNITSILADKFIQGAKILRSLISDEDILEEHGNISGSRLSGQPQEPVSGKVIFRRRSQHISIRRTM